MLNSKEHEIHPANKCWNFNINEQDKITVSLLLNLPVKSYDQGGMVTSDFVGLFPNIEMNDTPSPAIKHCPRKRLKVYMQVRSAKPFVLGWLRPSKQLTRTCA